MAHTFAGSSNASSPDSAATQAGSGAGAIQKSFSCVLCAQRKVKCDKAPGGCSNCTKARVECVYKAPPPPRRRKKGVRELDIHAKLRLYEGALRRLGVEPDELVKQELGRTKRKQSENGVVVGLNDIEEGNLPEESTEVPGASDVGVLVSGDGKSRYLDNALWTSLKSEFRDSKEILDDTSDDEDEFEHKGDTSSPTGFSPDAGNFLIGSPRSTTSLRCVCPRSYVIPPLILPLEPLKISQIEMLPWR